MVEEAKKFLQKTVFHENLDDTIILDLLNVNLFFSIKATKLQMSAHNRL